MATAKQVALEIVGSLPDDCTLKDAAYGLTFGSSSRRPARR